VRVSGRSVTLSGVLEEIPLAGGNVSDGVVRVGDTVRRPAGPWTPAVHALLAHLHEVGFHAAPRPLGLDERGREVLEFVPGATVWPDRFGEVGPRDRLARAPRSEVIDARSVPAPRPGRSGSPRMDHAALIVPKSGRSPSRGRSREPRIDHRPHLAILGR
jgi:hypothetical protein